jgi:hypothetical protein
MSRAEKRMEDERRHTDKISLGLKGAVLALALVIACGFPDLLPRFFAHRVLFFRVYHLIWLGTVLFLIKRMMPALNGKITSGKQFGRHYRDSGVKVPKDAAEARLEEYTRQMNLGALKVAVYWALVILVSGGFYHLHMVGATGLFIIVIFFIFMDQFCISVWCPFLFIIGNKCCNTCRINNWGYLMAFAPPFFFPPSGPGRSSACRRPSWSSGNTSFIPIPSGFTNSAMPASRAGTARRGAAHGRRPASPRNYNG